MSTKAIVTDERFRCGYFHRIEVVSGDEEDRADSLNILKGISETNRPVVPWLWFYEIGNALTFAVRRKRVVFEQVEEFLRLLEQIPIDVDEPDRATALRLPYLCREHNLTTYDAAYLELAMRLQLPLATCDNALIRAAADVGVQLARPNNH